MSKKLMLSLLSVVSFLICNVALANEECLTAGGKTVCGYDCKISSGKIDCAKTEYGACIVAGGRVQCWDPPSWVRKKASCWQANGEAACGYECRIAAGKASCASTPYGVCTSVDGQMHCWDPPRSVDKKAECALSNGKYACGYDCMIAGGEVKCASTPSGRCSLKSGSIVCSDSE